MSGILEKIKKHVFMEALGKMFLCLVPPVLTAPFLRLLGARVGKNPRIYTPLVFSNTGYKNLKIGHNCHIGRDCFLDLVDKIVIEDNVTISMRTTLVTHLHYGDSMSQYSERQGSAAPIHIEENVYIGAGVIILHGVRIGRGSTIGAGAVVLNDIPPHSLAVGVPAKVVKRLNK